LLLAVLLGALLSGWAHAAVHADEANADGACAACHWVKHSPVGAVPVPQALAALLFVALVIVSAPLARGGIAVARPSGRAPPRAA
jgi:hypothetical protein